MLEKNKKNTNKNKMGSKLEEPSLLQDIIKLLIKIAVIALFFALLFGFVFGAYRYNDLSMSPDVKDGDLVVTYRWDKHYSYNDLTILWYNNQLVVSRIVAKEGDVVDINSGGLIINGKKVTETGIFKETTQVKDSDVKFPLNVPQNEIFVLGDNRNAAIDSRTFGCVETEKTEGKVIGLFRHRGL